MSRYILLLIFTFFGFTSIAQQLNILPQEGMRATHFNYTSFHTDKIPDAETIMGNKGYESHPEIGATFKETPCKDCYEDIGQRKEYNKTYVKKGSNKTFSYTQTCTQPMHYKDAAGNWLTIDPRLKPSAEANGIYAAKNQTSPTCINTVLNNTQIQCNKQIFTFNNQLELIHSNIDGSIKSLGYANWSNITVGEDGAYITNAWDGIDLELRVVRGGIKTNYWINKPLPALNNGFLSIRDHVILPQGLHFNASPEKSAIGVLSVKNEDNIDQLIISAANIYEKNTPGSNEYLPYIIGKDNSLDIVIDTKWLNKPADRYPIIIDPLVTAPTTVTVPGSTYSPGWTTGCSILNPASVPPDLTITDLWFTFEYEATGGALMANGSMDFRVGTCRSPSATGFYWYCLVYAPGTCGGSDISIYSHVSSCIPPVTCAAYDLNVTMNFYQNYASVAPCSNLYIIQSVPLTITVVGHTLDAFITPDTTQICQGDTATFVGSYNWGIPPYSYSWTPSGSTSSSIAISPATTTVYTLTVTDGCGTTAIDTQTLIVHPIGNIIGDTIICMGTPEIYSLSAGTGAWSSSPSGILAISAGSGYASGLSAGTSTISCTTLAGCRKTLVVNVYETPTISNITFTQPTSCYTPNGSFTISGLSPGTTYTITYLYNGSPQSGAFTAGPSGEIILNGLSGGTYASFNASLHNGCPSNTFYGPYVLNNPSTPATPTATNNGPACEGSVLTLSATSPDADIIYSWTGPLGFTSSLQNPQLAPAYPSQSGFYTVVAINTVTGCSSSLAFTNATIYPLPIPTSITTNNPSNCGLNDGYISFFGLIPGTSYSITYEYNGAITTVSLTSDASGQLILSGLAQGTLSNIVLNYNNCFSTPYGPYTLVDPGAPPSPLAASNSPVCEGSSLNLSGTCADPNVTFTWLTPSGTGYTGANVIINNAQVFMSGVYTLQASFNGCSSYDTILITVNPKPVLSGLQDTIRIPYLQPTRLYVIGANYYTWYPNDGSIDNANINTPLISPINNLLYTVIGMNNWGCKDSLTTYFAVSDNDSITVPTAFTPNNDGNNDVFRIPLLGNKLVLLSIFNRWGELIYEANSATYRGWDGSYKGEPQELGTYYYMLIYVSQAGVQRQLSGEVTLIR